MSETPWYLAPWAAENATWRTIVALRRACCLLTLALLAATWRLWVPPSGFPGVPLLAVARSTPVWLEAGLLALAVCGLIVGLFARAADRRGQLALLLFAAALGMLWLINQHRLQPWAYQMFLFALTLGFVEPRRAIALLRLLLVSIYLFSAISKLDYTFLHSLGPQFTESLMQLGGATGEAWTATRRALVASVFPLGEALAALLLSIPRARRIGLVVALAMHAMLLLILGPMGMRQQPGVLLWNVAFMTLLWLLFRRNKPRASRKTNGEVQIAPAGQRVEELPPGNAAASRWGSRAAEAVLLLAIVAPTLEPLGWCDHWLAWGLYSPGASRAQVFVRTSDIERLPAEWRSFVDRAEDAIWQRVRIDRWSLETLRAPIYPQARFQLGVALAVANALPPESDARVEWFGAAGRFSGDRQRESLETRPQLEAAARRFWLNAQPRLGE